MPTWRYVINCECGHDGKLCIEGEDPPAYGLEGFDSEGVTFPTIFDSPPKDPLAALDPTCPACGEKGKVQRA